VLYVVRKGEALKGRARMCLPFVLKAFCALAGPPPYTEPDVKGETDDPEGIPSAQRLIARVPLVRIRNSGALAVRRDGQERDDRDDLLWDNTLHQQGHRVRNDSPGRNRLPVPK
jgi:hypothetical protein